MRRIVLISAISFVSFLLASAQSDPPDKIKVAGLFQRFEFEEAISYLLPLKQVDSTNLEILLDLAYAYSMTDDPKSATAYYQRIYDLDSNNISANQYLLKKYNYSNPDLARTFAQRLITLQPRKTSYFRSLGSLLLRLNNRDSAFKIYYKAYLMSPDDSKNIVGVTGFLIEDKKFREADSLLQIGLSKDSLNMALIKMRVSSAYESEDYKTVADFGQRLISSEDAASTSLTQLAYSYYNIKLYKNCVEVCEHMTEAGVGGESVFYCEAKAYNKMHEFNKSSELLDICLGLAISKKAEIYLFARGDNLEELKKYSSSIKQYDTAYYLFRNPLMLYKCARIYDDNLHNKVIARKYYQSFLQVAKKESAEEKKVYEYVKFRLEEKDFQR